MAGIRDTGIATTSDKITGLPTVSKQNHQPNHCHWTPNNTQPTTSNIRRPSADILRGHWPSTWPLTLWAKNQHTSYSCPGKCLHQFWLLYTFSFPSWEPIRDRGTPMQDPYVAHVFCTEIASMSFLMARQLMPGKKLVLVSLLSYEQ